MLVTIGPRNSLLTVRYHELFQKTRDKPVQWMETTPFKETNYKNFFHKMSFSKKVKKSIKPKMSKNKIK
jgi:hypothetical protein